MNCLPLWIVKCCARILALLYTQTPSAIIIMDNMARQNTGSVAQYALAESPALAPCMILLPSEVQHRLLWDSIAATANDITELKKRIAYILSMRTVDKPIK